MLAVERKAKIQEIVDRQGSVECGELIRIFEVTGETLRKDLMDLESKGLLYRTHGGAVSTKGAVPIRNVTSRMDEHIEQKRELSKYALQFVDEGDIIAIDEGSTAVEFANMLVGRFKSLTIITHCMSVFNCIRSLDGFNVILTGGQFLKDENAFYGQIALDTLSNIRVGKLFLCPSAVSLESGVMDFNCEMYQIQRKYLTIADRVFVLADSSKFCRTSVFKICDIMQNITFVTDSGITEGVCKQFAEKNINLIRGED